MVRARGGVLRCDHAWRAVSLAALITLFAAPAFAQKPAPASPLDAADVPTVSSPVITPSPLAALTLSAQQLGDSIVAFARRQIGTRYRFGSQNPQRGLDCSGLVRYVMSSFNISLPRTAAAQARVGQDVPRDTSALRPGDLLMFGQRGRVSHVGIYAGNGMYIQASSTRGQVIEVPLLRTGRRIKPWVAARRVLPTDTLPVRLASADTSKHLSAGPNTSSSPSALLPPR